MHALSRLSRRMLLPLVVAALLVPAAGAQAPPLRVALEINAKNTLIGHRAAAESVTRQVAASLTSQLEAAGWQVTRVYSARKASRNGRFHAAARVDVDAKYVFHIRDAHEYENDHGRRVILDYTRSAEAWGDLVVRDGTDGRIVLDALVRPIEPALHSMGTGLSELDDEASIARLFADAVAGPLKRGLELTRPGQ